MPNKYGFSKLVVRDLKASASFYEEVCGLTKQAEVVSTLGGRHLTEIIYEAESENCAQLVLMTYHDEESLTTGEAIIGFYSDNIYSFVENAVLHGATVIEQVNERPDFQARIALVRDPEGHLIEIIEHTDT